MSEQLGWYARVEGIDGTGKSTQLELARQYSEEKGIDTVFIREPGGTEFGNRLRAILLNDTSIHLSPQVETALFTADRRHLCDEVIFPSLEKDMVVISDRGVESGVCYQSAGGGISREAYMAISNLLLPERYMRPDALALLSLREEVRRKRIQVRFDSVAADKIESRGEEYTRRVYDAYRSLEELDYATVIDAEPDPEQVFEQLKPVLFGKFAR
ncbi:MAG: thymidylate kinase [Candidatus Saccharibacteria bacterium]|jgi:dTMP kinase|nr:thymidylate kinase [Candidatus Saccharibacteria bacterium]